MNIVVQVWFMLLENLWHYIIHNIIITQFIQFKINDRNFEFQASNVPILPLLVNFLQGIEIFELNYYKIRWLKINKWNFELQGSMGSISA